MPASDEQRKRRRFLPFGESTPMSKIADRRPQPAVVGGLVYVTVRTLLEGFVAKRPVLPDIVTSSAEIGFGIAIAFAAVHQIWLAVALAPLLLLVERLYSRVAGLRATKWRQRSRPSRTSSTSATRPRMAIHCGSHATSRSLRRALAFRRARYGASGGRAACTTSARWPSTPRFSVSPGS